MNGMHIRQMSTQELSQATKDRWPDYSDSFGAVYKDLILPLIQERLKKLDELADLTWFFFKDPSVTQDLISLIISETKLDASVAKNLLEQSLNITEYVENFTSDILHDEFYKLSETTGKKPGELFKLIRIALVGGTTAPGLFETMHVLGKEVVNRRLKAVIEAIK
jgi:glutamyl-tRNA synthetase